MPRIIDCFDKIKNKEVKLLQEAFNTLVPSDTELTEEQQREIGKKIALDYKNIIYQELADLKENLSPVETLPPYLEKIIDKTVTIGDNFYSDKIKSINKTKRGYSITDAKGQTFNVITDRGILLSDDLQGEMSGVIPSFRPVSVQTSDGWQTVRKTTEEILNDINAKKEKIEKEAKVEINKVDPKLPVGKLPIKSKVAQRKIRNAKLSSDLDKALAELKKPTGNITTGGIDPIKLERAVTVIGLYIKGGVYKFSDIIEDAYARLGEEVKDIYDLLKTVYGGYYFNGATKKEAELMDLSERDLTFDDITQNLKSEYVDEEDFQKIKNNEPRRKFIDAIKEKIKNEEKQNIISLRKIAAEYGIDVKDTTLQEMVEMAVVELGREIANNNWQDLYKLEGIIDIYDNQPTISMRSAERIEKQQYSTPIPTAYLAGLYVAAINPKSVFEPSAGNGVMTIAFDPSKVIVNEIDDVRLENLSEQNFASVTNQDALLPFSITPKDGIVMNPPFGSSPEIEVDGYKIAGLDEQMIVNALSNLSSNGRAAIIMGGHNRYDDKGRLISERTFFNYLYNHYKVDAVLNMDGQLYQKQGTQFPTRLILINGVKQNPEGATPLNTGENPVISSFYDLFKIINKLNQDGAQNILQPGVDANHANGRNIHEQGSKRSNINQGELFGLPEGQVHPTGTGSGSAKGTPGKSGRGHSGSTSSGKSNSEGIGRNDNGIGPVPDMGEQVPPGDGRAGGIDAGGSGNEFQRNDVIQPVRKFEANDLTKNEKVPYQPKSKSASVDTVIPSQMATDAEKILTDIDNEYGGIDNFVQKKLKYPDKQALHNALSGEQIDAVAMAIVQIENGEGMIIGDMTGVGKGRVAAAVLRYAVNAGKQPIFLTEDAGLFSDFYRDLLDIGSERLVPFIVNDKSGQKNDPTITDKDGNVIHRPLSKEVKQSIFRSKTIPKNANFVLASYSQFRTSPDKPSIKRDFFQSIAQGNILILDESHNVSGDSNSGALFQDIISSTQGVLFLSATFAKRPNNMPVYALKTAMKEANMSTGELVSAIEHGGVALQEVVSSQLVESGQMLRRERAFDGVSIDYEVLDEVGEAHREIADNVTEIIRDIINFQTVHINTLIDQLDGEAAAAGGNVKGRKGTSQAGVSNTPFANKVFNVVDQLLFSIKAIDMADAAIQELKRGRKPVVTFKSTMGSFLKYLDVQPGELLEKADFSLTLKKALEGVMRYTEKDAGGKAAYKSLSQADLTEEGRVEWRRIMNKITQVSLGITISPIDVIIKRIEDAGYSVKEITGRDARLDLRDDGTAIVATRNDKDKKKSVREFNNGDLDVLLLNVAGATGISLHASGKFKDQRQRVMIDGQLELDISKAVQKMGRIDRVGQVVRGAYRFIISAIQAEKRMLMMFKSKLKSLNANTTSSQKSETSNSDVVDFLNKYGDEVVTEYLKEERELNDKMLDPLKFNDKSDDEVNDIKSVEGAARKVTGKAAILNTREQETFYKEIIERYKDYIEYLDSNNSNDLEVKVLPLNATTINKSIIVSGKGGSTPFGQDSFLEQLEIDVLKKPLKKENIDKEIVDGLEGLTPEQKSEEIVDGINDHYEKDLAKQLDKIETQDVQNRIDVANRAREKAIKDGSSDIQGDVDGALERLEFAKNETIKRITTKNNFVNSNLTRLAKYFKIGNLYEVPISVRTDTMVGTSKGVFLGFNIKKTRKNPYAPSAITIRFAVNDSRRIVSIPLSKQDFINAIIANSNFFTPEARQKYIDNWDSLQSTRTRQQRYMMTGNLLQAFGTNDGQIVAYTDDKGGLRKGILLPEAYQVADQKIRIPIGQSAKYLIKTGDKLTTIDKDVVIQKENTGFTITVPLSNQSGGKYFLNKGLQELVNERGFNQMSNRMTAYFSDSKLQPLLDFLQNTFNLSIEVEGAIKKAETKSSTPTEVQPISENEEKLKQKEDNRTELSKISAKLKYVFDKLLKSGSSVKASETLHGNLSEMESKILNNTINSLEALAVNKGKVSFNENLQSVNYNFENVDGKELKINTYEIGGYKIELKSSQGRGSTWITTPSGNWLMMDKREVSALISNRADNSVEFQYYEPLPENIKDLVDVIAEQMDNGITSLAAIQDYIASELGDYSEELKGQIEEAFSEYTKMNTPEEISQAINDAIEENLSVAFGGKDKVNIVDDADIVNLASNLENVQYNSVPLSTQISEDGIPYLSESTSNTYPTPGDIQREGGSGANNLSVRASWSKLNHIKFDGSTKVKSHADVAFIMRKLENKSVEHGFVVHIDAKGKSHIQFLGIGGITGVVMDPKMILAGVKKFKSVHVTLVHNHPSGNLVPSNADRQMTTKVVNGLKPLGISVDHVIMNTYSKRYTYIDSYDGVEEYERPTETEISRDKSNDKNLTTHILDEFKILDAPLSKVTSSRDAANFIQQLRFSAMPKMGLLLLNQANKIIGNYIFRNQNNLLNEITMFVAESGIGVNVIVYGNSEKKFNATGFNSLKNNLKSLDINLLDFVVTGSDTEAVSQYYKSMADEGLLNETFEKYGTNLPSVTNKVVDGMGIVSQHSIDITPELRSQVQGGQPLFMKSPDGKIIGFTHNGKVYLNKKYLNPNTPIHEAGHIWTNWAEKYSVDVYDAGIRLVEGSRYYDKATSSKVYQELAKQEALKSGPEGSGAYNAAYTKYMKHEALAMAIGDRGAQFVTEAKKKGFKEWLDNLWETIKNALGFTGITTDELANLTFEEFTSRAAADILRKQKNTSSTNHKKADQTATDNLNDNLGQDDPIEAYEMNSTQEIKNFISGDTITAALGNAPEGDQSYYAKKLNQMLEDGKQMIEHFKAWVNLGQNVEDYGKQLLGYIQRMGSDAALNSKKAVLLATFLSEIAEEINRNPQKRDLLRNLNNEVTAYYQDFMRKVSTDLNAARLLRLYRDKYMGDLFVNQIMEEREIREKSDLQKAELDSKTIEDRVAEEVNRITEEMKARAEAEQAAMAAAAAAAANKKKPGKKAEFSKEKEAAANRMKANNNTLASIIDRIKNLNCK